MVGLGARGVGSQCLRATVPVGEEEESVLRRRVVMAAPCHFAPQHVHLKLSILCYVDSTTASKKGN